VKISGRILTKVSRSGGCEGEESWLEESLNTTLCYQEYNNSSVNSVENSNAIK